MNGLSTVLIVVGLFLVGGIISFARQQMPKGLIVLWDDHFSLGNVVTGVGRGAWRAFKDRGRS